MPPILSASALLFFEGVRRAAIGNGRNGKSNAATSLKQFQEKAGALENALHHHLGTQQEKA